GYGGYAYFHASRFVSTDNAYTAAETAQVTPAIGGVVRGGRGTHTHAGEQGGNLVGASHPRPRPAPGPRPAQPRPAPRRPCAACPPTRPTPQACGRGSPPAFRK